MIKYIFYECDIESVGKYRVGNGVMYKYCDLQDSSFIYIYYI